MWIRRPVGLAALTNEIGDYFIAAHGLVGALYDGVQPACLLALHPFFRELCSKFFRHLPMSKVPADIPTTIRISPMPEMCFYAVASMEIIHSIPLVCETTLRHERFDNIRKIPFDEFVACHPQSPARRPAY